MIHVVSFAYYSIKLSFYSVINVRVTKLSVKLRTGRLLFISLTIIKKKKMIWRRT
jgi:hypothetical protein